MKLRGQVPYASDRCDTMFAKASTPAKSESQQRFLDAYRETLRIATAARRAGVHRSTVYRWRADPAFVQAMKAAAQDFFRDCRSRVMAQEDERRRWRQERELARRPMRCANLARARAARRRR